MTEIATLQFKAVTGELTVAEQKLNKVTKAGARTEKQAAKVGSAFANNRHKIQNAAFQFQDIAVQMEGGIAASRIFAQQVPQLLGGFGAGGAIFGVVAGFGAMIGSKLIDNMFGAVDAAKALEKAMESLEGVTDDTAGGVNVLAKEIEELADRSMEAATAQIQSSIIRINASFKDMRAGVKELKSDLVDTFAAAPIMMEGGSISNTAADQISAMAKSLELTNGEALRLEAIMDKSTSVSDLRESIDAFFITMSDPSDKLVTFRDKLAGIDEQYREMRGELDLLEGAQSNLTGTIAEFGVTAAKAMEDAGNALDSYFMSEEEKSVAFEERRLTREQAANDRSLSQLELYFERESALSTRENDKRERDAARRAATEMRLDSQLLSAKLDFASNVAGALAAGAEEGSAIQKAAFAAQQAIAVASTIMNTEAAATAALAPPPIGLGPVAGVGYAQGIRTMGYASAGLQAGLAVGELAARAQGGQVRPGESYRVGEFGPETLVMGSSGGRINPAGAANDGMKLEVVNNIEVRGGGEASVTTTSNQVSDKKVIQNIVIDMLQPSGTGFRSLQRNSNLQPRGTR